MYDLLAAQRHTIDNHDEVEASTLCGCCNCLQTFPPQDIVAYSGLQALSLEDLETLTGGTALCPHCGSESVIGDRSGYPINADFLGRMNEAWFQKTIIRRPAPKA